ncbi:hypothetical protein [Lacimicrobium sp. SS2-24]|uniref:MMPL family transporter n=1 Tax=Lacimicrobium sp. SS2-24 TaxID=2005569 RepID=UPI000B4B3CFA|nr:hypothetical protein [Lacimicrobium sp. SS2-24]
MWRRTLWVLLPALMLAALVGWWLAAKQGLNSNILATLPQSQQSILLRNADEHFSAQFAERVLVSVTGLQATAAHDALKRRFSELGWLNSDAQGVDIQMLLRFYSRYRSVVLNEELENALGDANAVSRAVFGKLSQPSNPFVSGSFEQDPSLNTAGFVEQRVQAWSPFKTDGQRLYQTDDQDQRHYFLVLSVSHEQQQMGGAKAFYDSLQQHLQALQKTYPEVQYHYSGIALHTAENALQAEYEMNLFGGLSLLGVILVLWWAFGSLRPLMVTAIVILYSGLAGIVATLLVFQQAHVLSLVFGITLIGIAIDYSVHRLTHSNAKPNEVNAVARSITLGFVTTALGYSLFAFSPIGVLSQVAVFVVAGLAAAWLLALIVVPWWLMDRPVTVSPTWLSGARWWCRHLVAWQPKMLMVTLLLTGLSAVWLGFSPLNFNDHIRLLNGSSQQLLENEALHHRLLGGDKTQRFMVQGQTLEMLLETEEQVADWVAAQEDNAEIQRISNWLPSLVRQRQQQQKINRAQQDGDFAQVEELLGVRLDWPEQNWLSSEAVQSSPLKDVLETKVYQSPDGVVSWISISNLRSDQQQMLLTQFPDSLVLYDKAAQLTQLMEHFRQQLLLTLAGVLLAATAVLAFSLGLKPALKGALVMGLSIIMAWEGTAMLVGSLSLFNVLSAMLIIALAVDYLVFYVRQGASEKNLVAITLSLVSSLLVFGVLAFSNTPAISAFGLTAALGLVFLYALSPMVMKGRDET